MPEVRYLPEQDGQGFVDVRMTATGEIIALPGYLNTQPSRILRPCTHGRS